MYACMYVFFSAILLYESLYFERYATVRVSRGWRTTKSKWPTTLEVDLGQIRSEEIVYSRFIKVPSG